MQDQDVWITGKESQLHMPFESGKQSCILASVGFATTLVYFINPLQPLSELIFVHLGLIVFGFFGWNGIIKFARAIHLDRKRWSYRTAGRQALFRNHLFQANALLTGWITVNWSMQQFTPIFGETLLATPLESMIDPGVFIVSLLAGLLVAGCLLAMPVAFRMGVMAGAYPEWLALDVFRLGSIWLLLGGLFPIFIDLGLLKNITGKSYYSMDRDAWLYSLGYCSVTSIVGYSLPFWLKKNVFSTQDIISRLYNQAQTPSIWLVFSSPVTSKLAFKLIDQLSEHWRSLNLTLAAPNGSSTFGIHSYWAYTNKSLKALFPVCTIELADWWRTQPTTQAYPGFTRREIYPTPDLLAEAVVTLRSNNDPVVLVHELGNDLEPWRGLLPAENTWLLINIDEGNKEIGIPQEIAGYRAIHLTDIDQLLQVPVIKQTVKESPVKTANNILKALNIKLSLKLYIVGILLIFTVGAGIYVLNSLQSSILETSPKTALEKFIVGYTAEFGTISEEQKAALTQVLSFIEKDKEITDIRYAAYILATIKHETADRFQPRTEYGNISYFDKYEVGTRLGKSLGNTQPGDGYRFRGRGYGQIVGRMNYYKASNLLGLMGTDNDLVEHPEKILEPQVAYPILSSFMTRGLFTGKKLSDYITGDNTDYKNARKVYNGLDRADLIAGYADIFEKILRESHVWNE